MNAPRRGLRISGHLLALVAMVAVPLFLTVLYQVRDRTEAAERVAFERLDAMARVHARALERINADVDTGLALATSFAAPRLSEPRSADAVLREILDRMPAHMGNVTLVGLDGSVLASARNDPALRSQVNFADRDYFRAALATRGIVVSEPLVARTSGKWRVVYARTVRDAQGAPRMVAVSAIDLDRLAAAITIPHEGEPLAVRVLTRDGHVVAQTAGLPLAADRRLPGDSSLRTLLDGGEGATRRVDATGAAQLASVRLAGPWIVAVEMPAAAWRERAWREGLLQLGVILLTGLVGGIAAVLIGRRVGEADRKREAELEARRRAEHALALGEERMLAATEGARIGVYDFQVHGGQLYLSPSWKAQLGFADTELESSTDAFLSRVHPDDLPRLSRQYGAYCADPRGAYQAEFRLRHRDGSWRWIRSQGRMFPDAEGRMARLIGAHVDVTEDRQRAAALAASEERARLALRAGRMAAWEWTGAGEGPIAWGEGAELILGPTRPGAEPPELMDLVLDEDLGRFVAARARLLDGSPCSCDFRIARPDGEIRWIKLQGLGTRGPDGLVDRITGFAQDITDRVADGERLRDSEARHRALVETTTDAILMLDTAGLVTYANPAVKTLFGWEPGELVGRPVGVLQSPEARAAHAAAMERYYRSGERTLNWRAMETTALARDGREIPVEISLSTVSLSGRLFFVGFLRDVSIRKRAERELQAANANLERHVEERTAQLQAANRELESFSYTVAHDLRAPLRAIDGFSRMLQEDHGPVLPEDATQSLARIRANTSVMSTMIEELLELSRIGRTDLAPRTVDIAGLARQVVEQLAPTYPGANVVVGAMSPVQADPTLLRMVFANLIGNALKFSSKNDRPRISVNARQTASETIVTVADNGVGFDPRYAAKLFGVFQRLHTREEFEGTGVGLATVARIVQRHGGRIWADSRPGAGASFHFSLPRIASGEAAREAVA